MQLERWEDALRDYEVLRVEMPNDMEVERGYFDAQVALKKSRGEEIHKMKFGGEVEEVFNEDQFKEVVTFPGKERNEIATVACMSHALSNEILSWLIAETPHRQCTK